MSCTVAASIGIALTALAPGLPLLLLGYGVVFGVAGGAIYIILQQAANLLVRTHTGLLNGYVIALYPMGAMRVRRGLSGRHRVSRSDRGGRWSSLAAAGSVAAATGRCHQVPQSDAASSGGIRTHVTAQLPAAGRGRRRARSGPMQSLTSETELCLVALVIIRLGDHNRRRRASR
jgi:hypothetical protein